MATSDRAPDRCAGTGQRGVLAYGNADHRASVGVVLGGAAPPGSVVLTATWTTPVVTVSLDATQQTDVRTGDRVGTAWKVQRSPAGGLATTNELYAAAASRSSVWAVGYNDPARLLLRVDSSAALEIIQQDRDGMADHRDTGQRPFVQMIGITPLDGRTAERAAPGGQRRVPGPPCREELPPNCSAPA